MCILLDTVEQNITDLGILQVPADLQLITIGIPLDSLEQNITDLGILQGPPEL